MGGAVSWSPWSCKVVVGSWVQVQWDGKTKYYPEHSRVVSEKQL